MFENYVWLKIEEALDHAIRNAHKNNKREWARIKQVVVDNAPLIECKECEVELIKLGSNICVRCAAKPWQKLEELTQKYITELGYTAESYAEKIIQHYYPEDRPNKLPMAVAQISAKLDHWIMEWQIRENYTFADGVNNDHIAESQAEARVKRDAYRLAYNEIISKAYSQE